MDSSLIAALLADIETDTNRRRTSPTQAQVNELRSILRELAAQADVSQLSEFSNLQLTSPTDASSSSFDFYFGDTSSSRTSEISASSQDVLASQLGFLQAALPNVKEKRLKNALAQAALQDDEPDLWNVISSILSDEAARELEERGPEGLGDNNVHNTMFADDVSWDVIQSRKQSGHGKKAKRKQKITLIDIRQQHHARPAPKSPTSATDPWDVVMSIAEQLSSLVPSRPALYFQSYFHSPAYSTPYEAACAALTAIHDVGSALDDDAVLSNVLDIISPGHEEMLDTNQRSNLCSDIQLAINVTRGHTDDALDLVRILRDLDFDSQPGYMEMGIYHAPSQPSSPRLASASPIGQVSSHITKLPAGPPETPPPPEKAKSQPSENRGKRRSSEPQWQTVPQRKTPRNDILQVITSRPANARDAGAKIKGSGNGMGKGGKGDVGELAEHNRRIKESLRKRDECYREAHAMWRKGNAKTRGGEVAMFYVDKVRVFIRE